MKAFNRFLASLLLIGVLGGCSLLSPSFLSPWESEKFIRYPVRSGDTLFQIAARFDVSTKELEDVNDISDPSALQIGQLLKIPYHNQTSAQLREQGALQPDAYQSNKSSLQKVSLSSAKGYLKKLTWPVRGRALTSPFGYRWFSFHEGIDISAEEGTPFVAAHSGRVVYSGRGLRGYGNLIVIKGNGIVTVYGHNRRNKVSVGDQVEAGDTIGEVGATGKASGPHLHFEVRVKNDEGKNAAVDPLVFF